MVEHALSLMATLAGAACLMCLTLACDRRRRRRPPRRELAHEEAPGALDRHVACTLHDLNNLLTVIGVFAELIIEDADDPAHARDALAILRSQRRAQLLVRDLFAAEAHQGPAPLTDVGEVLDGSEAILEAITAGRAELSIQVEREARARIRPEALERVLLNLVVNAAEAMAGAGTIEIVARRGASGCVIEVADDGRGIHPDDMASIFRESYTTKTDHGNKGLGLHTVRALIERAGGSISCSSRPGHGTRFTVTLPAE